MIIDNSSLVQPVSVALILIAHRDHPLRLALANDRRHLKNNPLPDSMLYSYSHLYTLEPKENNNE